MRTLIHTLLVGGAAVAGSLVASTAQAQTNPTAGAPAWSTEFAANGAQWPAISLRPGGSATFGLADPLAGDGNVAQLVFPGAPGKGPLYEVGPGFATQISTPVMFRFGTFRARLEPATCASTEDVVHGFFTYFNNGKDEDGNGIIDNSEVDIEILCGAPHVVTLVLWTDYTSSTSFLGLSRQVDLSTGAYFQTEAANSYAKTPMGTLPQFVNPQFPQANTYYEVGFDWEPTEVRFFIVLGGTEITLWDYTDPAHIPTHTSSLNFNLWHPSTHWAGDGSAANYPASNAVERIDWARYWPSATTQAPAMPGWAWGSLLLVLGACGIGFSRRRSAV